MSEYSDEFRKSCKLSDDARDAGLKEPEDIVKYADIAYGDDPQWQILDIYRPKDAVGKLPVIVNVHGGGWVYGTKETYLYYCEHLAQSGFAVVNFTYRLAPENKFPASLEDMNMVMQFVLSHADEYGFDTDHIFAVGDSAGGHLLGLYSDFATNPQFAQRFSFKPAKEHPFTAIALNCGAYKVDYKKDEIIMDFIDGEITPEKMEMINVLGNMTESFPPAFVMTSSGDFLIEQGTMMVETLVKNKIPHEFHFYGDSENILYHVFHCDMRNKAAEICNREEMAFFKKFC